MTQHIPESHADPIPDWILKQPEVDPMMTQRRPRDSEWLAAGALLVVMVVVALGLLLLAFKVSASEYARDGGTADWQCCADKACATIISQHADAVRARDACGKLTDGDGATRYTRSNPFRVTKSGGTTPPPPVCPSKPADETRAGACPTGTTGAWTQSRMYASAAAPTCWTAGEWLPTAAPSGACVTPPPPTCTPPAPADLTQPGTCPAGTTGSWTQTKAYACVGTTWTAAADWTPAAAPTGACTALTPNAPAGLAASITPNATNPANSNVTLTWGAVAGVTAYEVWRCTGASCTNFAFLADASAATHVAQNQPPGLTWRYRVRAWKPTSGPYSDPLNVTTTAAPPPPPAGTGSAVIGWKAPTNNTDGTALTDLAGFRLYYGTQADQLLRVIDIRNAGMASYTVDSLAAGAWYFAVAAYTTAGGESANSNVVQKSVP